MAARNDRALRTACELLGSQARALAPAGSGLDRRARARLVILLDEVLASLDQPTTQRPTALADVLARREVHHQVLNELTREMSTSVGDATLVNIGMTRAAALTSRLANDLPVSVQTRHGEVRLADLLRITLVELVTMALAQGSTQVQPQALRDCVRTLTQVLGARVPGQTIEVRVPPAAAVQVGSLTGGPTHTRGTPPNVVETDERTWLELATGLLGLDEALDQGRATASGAHADELARMLPVADLRRLA